jgi:hypothetical protein
LCNDPYLSKSFPRQPEPLPDDEPCLPSLESGRMFLYDQNSPPSGIEVLHPRTSSSDRRKRKPDAQHSLQTSALPKRQLTHTWNKPCQSTLVLTQPNQKPARRS